MKCFYHSADLDGHCSGAIVKYKYPECEMIGINYGQEFPWDKIQSGEDVYMVDFTLQPFEQMERLSTICELVWIDHHKTEVEEGEKRNFHPAGIRRVGIGACALVWENLYPFIPVPDSVRLLAEYDVWNHSDYRTLSFQYGFRFFENTYPDNQKLWGPCFQSTSCVRVSEVCTIGNTLLTYEKHQNAKFCKAYAFDTQLSCTLGGHSEAKHFQAICCNKGFTNSKVFDSAYDPTRHDLMVTFCRLKAPAHKWTVSLYSTKDDVDCGQIARVFGGGGHKGAAGFQCEQLPFDY